VRAEWEHVHKASAAAPDHEGAAVAPRLGEASGEVRHPALGDVELALRRRTRARGRAGAALGPAGAALGPAGAALGPAGGALGPLGSRSALGPDVSQAKFVARGQADGQGFVPRARCRALQQLVHFVQRHEGNLGRIRLDLGCCHAQRAWRARSDA
jgi:hypothetical protein